MSFLHASPSSTSAATAAAVAATGGARAARSRLRQLAASLQSSSYITESPRGSTPNCSPTRSSSSSSRSPAPASPPPPPAPHSSSSYPFSPTEWRHFPLLSSTPHTHDTKILRFALPTPDTLPNLPVTSCVLLTLDPSPPSSSSSAPSALLARPYTPISPPTTPGSLSFLIKAYPHGALSPSLHALVPNNSSSSSSSSSSSGVWIKGPFPKFPYSKNQFKSILMLAGGTGITPMVQCLHALLSDSEDHTRVTLLFGSRSEDDVLLRDWLQGQALLHPHRLQIHHYLEDAPPSLPPSLPPVMRLRGRIDEEAIRKVGGEREGGREEGFGRVFVCGPPPFMHALSGEKARDKSQGSLEGVLKGLGWKEEEVYKF
ncbi:hypothetical protein VYU27_009384 [Nannochloropsis oceanica]